MISETKYFLKDKIKQFKYYKYLPKKQKNSDIYIVEFPKGGITWFSTIVANINLIESNSHQRATYYNIQQLIPDIHMNRNILDEPMWSVPDCRFIKSHHEWCPFYNHVIYLVRNPVSVMNSYYRFTTERNQFKGTFEEFLVDEKYGLEKWKNHVNSWLNKPKSQRMYIVKFEELRNNTLKTIKDLYYNLGMNVSEVTIESAIDISSLNSMKENESLYNKYDPTRKLDFVKEGKVKSEVSKDNKEFIISETKDILIALGYEVDKL